VTVIPVFPGKEIVTTKGTKDTKKRSDKNLRVLRVLSGFFSSFFKNGVCHPCAICLYQRTLVSPQPTSRFVDVR
jgi:hypothetical protein